MVPVTFLGLTISRLRISQDPSIGLFIIPAILAGGVGQDYPGRNFDIRTRISIYEPFAGCYFDRCETKFFTGIRVAWEGHWELLLRSS